jgi:aspartate/methionine/tyrosine aminotransferase
LKELNLLAERVNKINESPTMRVATEAKRMQAQGINVIDFSVGEPDFPTPYNIKEAAKLGIDDNHTRYTAIAGTVELRKAISQKLKIDNNLEYDLSEIIVTSGAKQSVFNALFAIVNKGEEVIIPAPYWVSYPDMVSMAEGNSVFVETNEKNGFRITPEQLEKAISPKTKALILCNPSNPTGSTYSKKELEDLAAVCLKHNFFIISDEIYEKLVYDNFEFVSFAALSPEIKKRTILVNGVSKSYAMTGWRIGYTAAPKDVISAMNKIQSHSTSHPSSVSQYAAVAALTGPQSAVSDMRTEYKKRRDYLYDQLVSIEGITCYKPEGAFFLFPNVSRFFGRRNEKMKVNNSFDLAMYLLTNAKIAVVPGTGFGAEGYLRISYATTMENIKEASTRFKETLQHLKP